MQRIRDVYDRWVAKPHGDCIAPSSARFVFNLQGRQAPFGQACCGEKIGGRTLGRARDHPVMEIVPNKALSLSLSLSLSGGPATRISRSRRNLFSFDEEDKSLVFGGCAFPPVSLGPAGDCPCKGLSEGSLCCRDRLPASLVFGGFAFLPVSLGPAGDCPCFGPSLWRVYFPPVLIRTDRRLRARTKQRESWFKFPWRLGSESEFPSRGPQTQFARTAERGYREGGEERVCNLRDGRAPVGSKRQVVFARGCAACRSRGTPPVACGDVALRMQPTRCLPASRSRAGQHAAARGRESAPRRRRTAWSRGLGRQRQGGCGTARASAG